MIDPRYKFTITVSAHILLTDGENRVLMAMRPDNWEWGPGRWGLTGGKVYEHESFSETIKRKTVQELGFEVIPEGLYAVKQLIIKNKQAFMFFFFSKYDGRKITGGMKAYKWFSIGEIMETPLTDFAEFFYKTMLSEYLGSGKNLVPMSMIQSLDYVKLSEDGTYKAWFSGMIKKDFNPEEIPDYLKWKKERKIS